MNEIEMLAGEVAADLLGVSSDQVKVAMADGSEVAGIDPVTLAALIEIIMNAIMEIFKNCPQNDVAVRESIKAPTIGQRVQALYVVRDNCASRGVQRWRRASGKIFDSMLRRAAKQSNETLDRAIDAVRNQAGNFLI